MMNYMEHIHRDPAICNGQPVIKGTRVTIRTVLANLASGEAVEQILKSYPSLKDADVKAVIAFAAASAEEDLPFPAVPAAR